MLGAHALVVHAVAEEGAVHEGADVAPCEVVGGANLGQTVRNAEMLCGVTGFAAVLATYDGAEVGLSTVEHAVGVHGYALELIPIARVCPWGHSVAHGSLWDVGGFGAEDAGTSDALAKFRRTRAGSKNFLMNTSSAVKVLLRPSNTDGEVVWFILDAHNARGLAPVGVKGARKSHIPVLTVYE